MDVLQNTSLEFLTGNSSLIQPIMQGITSLFLLGSFAFQTIFGFPGLSLVRREGHLLKRAVDDFITTEEPIALAQLLCNIGSSGCHDQGASSGIVIASPSTSDPDCKWLARYLSVPRPY